MTKRRNSWSRGWPALRLAGMTKPEIMKNSITPMPPTLRSIASSPNQPRLAPGRSSVTCIQSTSSAAMARMASICTRRSGAVRLMPESMQDRL